MQTKTALEIAATAAEVAISAANDIEAAAFDEPRISGTQVSLTSQGPVIFVDYCDEAAALEPWITQVAAELDAQDITGTLTRARTDTTPTDNETPLTATTAALTVPIDWAALDHDIATRHGAERGWYADPDLTTDLTTDLVTNAHNLSHWDIHPLDQGRHLVRAPDLTPWLTTDEPDPQTLTQARDNFGDLILNPTNVTTDLARPTPPHN